MYMQNDEIFETWVKPSHEAFEFWISFFPTAPLFGVEWRFAGTMETAMAGMAPVTPAEPEVVPLAVARVQPEAAMPEDAPVEIADIAEPEPAPEPAPDAEPTAPKGLLKRKPADADDLTAISGIGAGTAEKLNALGIYRYKQLAKMSEADLTWLDANVGGIKGACFRKDWSGQAKTLAG